MTARGTDWTLAVLVAVLAATGALTLFGGPVGFAVHDVAGLGLGGVLVWKLRRVWRRAQGAGLLAAALVAGTLVSGVLWSSAVHPVLLGYNPLNFHGVLGAGLAVAVLVHAVQRAKRPRTRDLTRRQLLASAGVGAVALLAWRVQAAGARRRFTGSFDAGDDFPATSWVADAPAPLRDYALQVGEQRLTADELDRGDELVATLDCTGGFYTTQRWRGTRLDRLLEGLDGDHVRVISVTGYRWSFDRAQASKLLLATHVAGAPLDHGHGAPVRLVAPGHRGFIWVKWVTRVEVHDGPDPGAFLSTLTSSFRRAAG